MTPFPRRDLGEGYDSEGYDVYFLSTMIFVVDRNSVKYALHTRNHTPRGYEGMKNRCLWTGPYAVRTYGVLYFTMPTTQIRTL